MNSIEGGKDSHAATYSNVFVNDIAKKAMLDKTMRPFPVSSVIVREQLINKDDKMPEILTIIVKREKGFNPENNDWEFLVFDGAATKIQQREKTGSCQACHAQQRTDDFVFRTYLSDDVRSKLK